MSHKIRTADLVVTMPDGSEWAVPVEVIARHRAAHYASEYEGDVERSLREDTWFLFEDDEFNVEDWAANNMDWSDVEEHARKVADHEAPDFQEGWVNGESEVRYAGD